MLYKKISLSLGLIALLLNFVMAFSPELTERFYSAGIFTFVRQVIDNTLGRLPSIITYAFIFSIAGAIIFFLVKSGNFIFHTDWLSLKFLTLNGLMVLSSLLFAFYLLWGFNYKRVRLEKSLNCNVENLKPLELEKELDSAVADLDKSLLQFNTKGSENTVVPVDEIRSSVANFLIKNHFVVKGKPCIDLIFPKGALYYFGISGIYNPFLGRACVEAGEHPMEQIFTIAHELSHAFGFTDEGDCNFLAYASLSESENPLLVYAARLNYFRYVGSAYRRSFPSKYVEKRKQLSPIIIADLDAINEVHKKFPTIFNTAFINDRYLKMQGVKDGVGSYSGIINWAAAWRKKNFANFTLK